MHPVSGGLRRRLLSGERAVGSFVLGHDPGVVRAAAAAGLDVLILDHEHGVFSQELTGRFIDVAQSARVSLFVRCAMNDVPSLGRLFDHGLDGAMVAGAHTIDDVRRILDAIKFPPLGRRGLNPFVPAARYGHLAGDAYMQQQNENTSVWILAENRQLFAGLAEICQWPGLDGVFLAPYDLSVDLGHPGEIAHPDVVNAMDAGVQVIRGSHRLAGVYCKDARATHPWIEKGVSFVSVGFDWSLLSATWRGIVQECSGK